MFRWFYSPISLLLSVLLCLSLDLPHALADSPAAFSKHSDPAPSTGIQPLIPEPMLFDLVRPLGARRGELEVNTLAVFPLSRRSTGSRRAPDELGLVPLSEDRNEIEWAPEIEFAFADGHAVEFELPMEGSHLEALKFAYQATFGTALEQRFIHGFQGIFERTVNGSASTLTGLYLAGMQFTDRFSALGMWGLDYEYGTPAGAKGGDRTVFLQNLSLFYALTDHTTLGFETNYAISSAANRTLLLLPQLSMELTRHVDLQFGAGLALSEDQNQFQIAMRLIYTFGKVDS